MKKTHLVELIHNIKTTIVLFVSITLFVCLSVAIYTGVSWMTTNISSTIDRIMKNTNYYDSEIFFPYGFDEKDLNQIRAIDDNVEIIGFNSTYEFFDCNNSKLQSLVYEVPKSLLISLSIDGPISLL